MVELPESVVLSKEINQLLKGKIIKKAIAAKSPHKFAWYHGEPEEYDILLANKKITSAQQQGGHVEIIADDMVILLSEGIRIRYYYKNDPIPDKHQLFIGFDDGSSLIVTVQMYAGILAFKQGTYEDKYYMAAVNKPSPLSDEFDFSYFHQLISSVPVKMSLKAFLATEQRIPGLGNGVLQDILFNAKMHPKRKINTLTISDMELLFESIKITLNHMVKLGGRDTEQDLFGQQGGYVTKLSKNTVNQPCPECRTLIHKQAYMGGSIYFCEHCQPIEIVEAIS